MVRAGLLPVVRFDAFVLDEGNAMLSRDSTRVELPPKAFDVLCELARRPGQLIGKDALLDAVWGHRHISESVLKTTIGQIRSALGDDARAPRLIETVARRGYRFLPSPVPVAVVVAPVAPLSAAVTGASASRLVSATSETPTLSTHLPPSLAAGLIGRQAALTRLATHWREADGGRRRIVWVTGEAGIGKTTLIDAFTSTLAPGTLVIHGQCVEQIGAGEPYAPVLDALSTLCQVDSTVPALLRSIAPTWRLQLPWLDDGDARAALQRELTGATQGRMLRELAELFERYTVNRPLLLVTEDLHWSDHATIQLLDHLARRRPGARLMWLGSCRPADAVASGHPFGSLRHELRLHGLASEIALEPFTEQEVADYLAYYLTGQGISSRADPGAGHATRPRIDHDGDRPPGQQADLLAARSTRQAPPDSFVRRLHAHTDGLPLFVAATTAELLAAGSARAPAIEWATLALAEAPSSLAGVIDRAVDRLPVIQSRLLGFASLIGVEFRVRTAVDAARLDPAEARTALEVLLRHGQWLEARPLARLADGSIDEICAFRHSLFRQVFLRRIGATDRVDAHRRILASLSASRAIGTVVSSAELAVHAEAALLPLEAIAHLSEAAASALAQFAPTEATHHAEAGLALLAAVADRSDGSTLTSEQRDEAELALTVHRGTAQGLLRGLGDPIARQAFERASVLCDRLAPTVPRAWFHGGIGWTWYALGDYPRARAHADRIAALAREIADPVLSIFACNLGGVTACFEGRFAEGIALIEKGLATAEGLDDALAAAPFYIDPVVSMHGNIGYTRLLAGDVDLAWRHIDQADARSLALGHPFTRVLAAWCRCAVAAEVQDLAQLEQAQRTLDALVTTHQVGQGRGPAHWFGALLMAWHGEPGALARLERGYSCHDSLGMHAGNTAVRNYGAAIALAVGDAAAALAQADAGLQLAGQIGERNFVAHLLSARARALAALGHPLAERAQAYEAAIATARDTGSRWGELVARDARLDDPALAATTGDEDRAAIRDLLPTIRGADDAPLVRRARSRVERRQAEGDR